MINIKYFVMDADGTLTDGKIYMGNNGELCKSFNIKDGYGIYNILIPKGIIPVVITGRFSKILENRCQEIGIKLLYQNIQNKIEILDKLLLSTNCTYEHVAYIGDDVNDLSCIRAVKKAGGLIGCPADAIKDIKQLADFVSVKNGGDGAVRDFINWIITL